MSILDSMDEYMDNKLTGHSRARAVAQNGNDGLHYGESVPDHYSSNKDYDLIDVIGDYKLNFNRGNIIKYIFRAGKKSDELDDLKKAKDYLEREIEIFIKNK